MSQNDCMTSFTISRRYVLVGLFIALGVITMFAVTRPLQVDEAEFYQTAWFMSQGKCIYKDFFQHHNPLSYWLYVPLVRAAAPDVTPKALMMLRLPSLVVLFASMGCLYYLFRRLFSPAIAAIGIFLLMTWPVFLIGSMFTRPDGLMNLCIILGLCTIFRKNGAGAGVIRWLICGLLCGLAFCFLQKAALFAVIFLLILIARVYRKTESWKTLIGFIGGLSLVGGIFIAVVNHLYGLELYWACCWKFNMAMKTEPLINMKRAIEWMYLMIYAFVPLWGLAGIFLAFKHRIAREFAVFALLGGYGSFIVSPFSYHQYAIFMMITSVPFAAWAICAMSQKYGKKFLYGVILAGTIFAAIYFVQMSRLSLKNAQQSAIQTELNRVKPENRYVFASFFYLFCPPPDYIWFNWDYTLPVWQKVAPAGEQYKARNYMALVKQYNPVLINQAFAPKISLDELRQAGYKPITTRYDKMSGGVWYNDKLPKTGD